MAARLCSQCDRLIPNGRLCVPCRHKMARRKTAAPVVLPDSKVTLVWGPPCGGKNTYVNQHKSAGDLVVDFDAIITALGGSGSHDQPEHLRPFTFDCVDVVMRRLHSGDHVVPRAWVIQSAPTRADRRPFRDCEVVAVVPSEEICRERAMRERPEAWLGYIDAWFAKYEPEA